MRRWMAGSLAVAVVGALGLIFGWLADPQRAAFAYLTAYLYVVSLAVGALFMVMISHAANVKWFVVIRRIGENVTSILPLVALLFIPVFLARDLLYPWSGELHDIEPHVEHLIHDRHWWLNDVGFGVRSVIYLAVFLTVGEYLRRWSIAEDTNATGFNGLVRMRRLALGGLVAVALAVTFAAFDWAMSVEPVFYSNAFGVYYFAGSFLAGISTITLGAIMVRDRQLLPTAVGPEHLHALGRLMLAHTIFWSYIAFAQYMLVWMADLPEEVPFYIARTSGGWYGFTVWMILGHFALPFVLLLQRDLKRKPLQLGLVAGWLLIVHYADLYWMVLPALTPGGFQPHWTDLAALLGVAAPCLAFGLWRASRVALYPVHDPLLAQSLRYEALL